MTTLSHRGHMGEFVPDGAEPFVRIVGVSDAVKVRVDEGADPAAVFRGLVDDHLDYLDTLESLDDTKRAREASSRTR